MATFTVYVPPGMTSPAARAERTVFVRDGFNWAAFLLGPLALLYRRLWLAAAAWLVVAGALVFAGRTLHLLPATEIALFLLLAALTGLETAALRQRSLDRRGFVAAELLSRRSREEAERAYFDAEAQQKSSASPAPTPSGATVRGLDIGGDVIGSFPHSADLG